MKTRILSGAFALAALVACKEKEEKNTIEEIIEIEEVAPETYAEISVKKGGSWKEDTREYISRRVLASSPCRNQMWLRRSGPGSG